MLIPDYVLLYVENPTASGAFYGALLGLSPVEASPTFVLFVLPSGVKLGLWGRAGVEPAVTAQPGSGELAFSVADAAAVERLYDDWRARGLTILQPPITLDFGYSFTACDADGHRLRVFKGMA